MARPALDPDQAAAPGKLRAAAFVSLLAVLVGACPADDGQSSGDHGSEDSTGEPNTTSAEATTTAATAGSVTGATTSTSGTSADAGTAEDTGEPGSGGPSGELSELSDEFDDPGTLALWSLRHELEGEPAQYSLLDIDETTAGQLTWVPNTGGWYGDFRGPFLFKAVEGDFIVETRVDAASVGSPTAAPTSFYNSAGLLVRSPDHSPGEENWVMHNTGYQNQQVGTEGKTTVSSNSQLTIEPGVHHGRLRICRVGAAVILARRLDGESEFRETHRFERGDLPSALQVGLIVNGWNSLGSEPDFTADPDLFATFDYVWFWRPQNEGDCLGD